MKLTTLLFGLLLAVGWTSSAYAQTSPNNIPDAVYPKSYYDALKYTWTDANGVSHESASTDLATDPYQIYELIRFVYGNPAFPGPKYGAYTSSFVREDPIHYHPVPGGWNIVDAASAPDPRVITINVTNNYSSWGWSTTYYYVYIQSIQLIDTETNETFFTWTPTSNTLPNGVTTTNNRNYSNGNGIYFNNGTGGTITLASSLTAGHNNVQLVIAAKKSETSNYYTTSIAVDGNTKNVTATTSGNFTWNFVFPEEGAFVQGTVATPFKEGYTALIVSVYDDATAADEDAGTSAGIVGSRARGSYFNNKSGYISYIRDRIKSVRLLTDGLRIGNADEHTTGTVFNCEGTYNKFFIISKGKAREKSYRTKYNHIGNTNDWWNSTYWYYGEVFPFQDMFEEFSPTTGAKGDQITDFYTEMQDGHVYSVVHDCASVIQEAHQFSMSGNSGTQDYAMSGMNFYIPDYRLTYWKGTDDNGRSVDGRDMNPYEYGDDNGKTGRTFTLDSYYWTTYFAQYNPQYAPKVGIYKITLEADAKQSAGYDATDPNKRKYDVTLNWVSSLNEMTGDMVPQTYEIYIVTYDADGTEHQTLLTTVTDETTYTYQVDQGETSKTITYVIKGYPTPQEGQVYPSFVAWSNLDDVVIPGLNDFLNLILDHYESDFVIGTKIGDEKNYYRNFLHVAAENDENSLTMERVDNGEKVFTLYRYDAADTTANTAMTEVGTLNFFRRNQENKIVGYGFTFATGENAQTVEDYHLIKKNKQGQTILDIDNAYEHSKLGMPQNNNGFDLRVKGNGDVVIQPNGYQVNFKEISVYDGTTPVAHWQVSDGALPTDWYVSPGSRWIKDDGTDYYYLEGGGYIAIPDMLSNNTLRVVINGFGDASTLAKISVNDHTHVLKNATTNDQNAKDYEWTLVDKYYKYVKVTNAADLTAGEYLIVNENINVAFDGSAGNLDAAANYINVDITETGSTKEIAESSLINDATFTIDPTAGTVKSAGGFYIGWTANGNNGLRYNADEAMVNAISFDGIEAHIKTTVPETVRELRFNNDTGQKRFRYYKEGNQQAIQLYKKVETTKPAGDHVIRLGSLPIIDQFAVSVAKNDHPARYGYVLKYVPGADAVAGTEATKPKSSSHVEVPVQHTGSEVNGFYTSDQVKADSLEYNTVKVDITSADVQMNLSNSNQAVFYYSIVSKENAVPFIDKDSTCYVSNLQNDNFTYQEMFKKSSVRGARYPAGEHHFYDSIPATGTYGQIGKTYVPFVTERAIDRFYFADDSLHNTYGSPVWANSVGQAILNTANAQKQDGWNTTWTDANNTKCKLYMLDKIKATGYLPDATVSNVDYEPYMFRLFVKSKNEKLRPFKYETNSDGNEVITAAEGTTTGPLCVWSGYLKYNNQGQLIGENAATKETFTIGTDAGSYVYTKDKINAYDADGIWNAEKQNAIFGAVDALATETVNGVETIMKDELEIIVRFYYKAKGATAASSSNLTFNAGNRAKEVPMFYAAEGSKSPSPATAVSEISYYGEIVSTTYFNVQGMQSDKPFDGINIVVTRFSNGTTSVSKVVK